MSSGRIELSICCSGWSHKERFVHPLFTFPAVSATLPEIEMQTSVRLRVGWGSELRVLWEDSAVLFCRGWRDAGDGNRTAVLAVTPAADHATPGTLERLAHEYGLKDELDGTWAARPLELVRSHERTLLVLEDPGGEPLDRLLGNPIDVRTFLRLAIGIATALANVHQRGLLHKDV